MHLKENEIVCDLCRLVINAEYAEKYIDSISWGSISGTAHYGLCCAECFSSKINKDNTVKGRVYA